MNDSNRFLSRVTYIRLIGNIFSFIVGLSVILGGLICIAWFAGSLLVYCLLDRPMWEEATLLGVTIFIFIWFGISIVSRRPSRSSSSKLSEGDIVDEHMEELKGFLDEIEEELSEARREDDEEEYERLEEIKLDYLRQIEGHQLENKVVVLRRLRKKARKAGRKDEAEEYAKRIKKHEAKLKKRGGRLQDQPLFTKIISYAMIYVMIGSIGVVVYFAIYFIIPAIMLAATLEFWKAWTGGSEWMRSPGVMIAVIFGCLALACVAVWFVSWYFSPDESETKKKSARKNAG